MVILEIKIFKLIIFVITINKSEENVNVKPHDCLQNRNNSYTNDITKNLIYESSLKELKLVLDCIFCDFIMGIKNVKEGKWYYRQGLEGKMQEIIGSKDSNFKILKKDNKLLINNYRKRIGFYSCHPNNPQYQIKIVILVDYIKHSTFPLIRHQHKEVFLKKSKNALKTSQESIAINYRHKYFNEKYDLVYDYYKDTPCSKCDNPGNKYMIYKCRLTQVSYYYNSTKHLEPSVSCDSKILKNYLNNNYYFKNVSEIPDMGHFFTCYVSCDSKIPNLTEISITEKPKFVTIFENESKKLLKKILMAVSLYPVPPFIELDYNITTINLNYLVERPATLTCPFTEKIEDKNFFFWYHNRTLLSSLKFRIITGGKCKVKGNKLIFGTMEPEYNGSYTCTYLTQQRVRFIISVENYRTYDFRNPKVFYFMMVSLSFFIFVFWHFYLLLKNILRKKQYRRKRLKHI